MTAPRPIRPEEIAVIRAALDMGRELDIVIEEQAMRAIESLTVVEECPGGSASVTFEVFDKARPWRLLADANGDTKASCIVGIQVWGRPDAITALDIYSYGDGDENRSLPDPATVRPFPFKLDEEPVDESGNNS